MNLISWVGEVGNKHISEYATRCHREPAKEIEKEQPTEQEASQGRGREKAEMQGAGGPGREGFTAGRPCGP